MPGFDSQWKLFFSANLHVNPICINPKPSHGAAPAQHTARRRHGTQCGAGTASRCPLPPTMSPIHRISGELLAVGAAHAAARARVGSALGVLRAALLLLLRGLGCHGGREKLAKGSPPTQLSSGPEGRWSHCYTNMSKEDFEELTKRRVGGSCARTVCRGPSSSLSKAPSSSMYLCVDIPYGDTLAFVRIMQDSSGEVALGTDSMCVALGNKVT